MSTPEERAASLALLVDEGLTFGECLAEYAKRDENPMNNWYRSEAQDTLNRDGEIEIDENTIVSGSDDHGEYVLAWVWVDGPTCTMCAAELVLTEHADTGESWWVDDNGSNVGDDSEGHIHTVD